MGITKQIQLEEHERELARERAQRRRDHPEDYWWPEDDDGIMEGYLQQMEKDD